MLDIFRAIEPKVVELQSSTIPYGYSMQCPLEGTSGLDINATLQFQIHFLFSCFLLPFLQSKALRRLGGENTTSDIAVVLAVLGHGLYT